MPKIQVRGLYKSFKQKSVLKNISLDINPQDSIVILGCSGSGKSVFVKIIAGLLKQDYGEIKIDDVKTNNLDRGNEIFEQIGFLFQGGALFDSMNIWQNVAFKLLNKHKMPLKKAKEIAIEKLEMVGLKPEVADLYVPELSGGMQKRAALARTIASDPKILFFDEPTTGLDPIMSEVINDLIIKCTKQLKATTIVITHDMRSAQKIGDKIVFLHEGNFIWQGGKEHLLDSENPYIHQFVHGLSTGPINF